MKIIKIPFGQGGLGHGNDSYLAPNKIQDCLKECFANENGIEIDFHFEEINLNQNDIEDSHKRIEDYISKINEKSIILGGDHSITYSCVKGFRNILLNNNNNINDINIKNKIDKNIINNIDNNKEIENNKDFLFIVFDAHPDLMDDFSPPSQEGYLRNLIEEKIIKPENVILIGIRNWDTQEIDYINSKKIKCFTSKTIFEKGIKEVVNEILKIIDKKENKIYLSLDIDVVDPIEAIGTGYIEHGGMSSRELIYFIQKIKETKKIQMIDLVEINPKKDINDITSKLGAKLVTELGDY